MKAKRLFSLAAAGILFLSCQEKKQAEKPLAKAYSFLECGYKDFQKDKENKTVAVGSFDYDVMAVVIDTQHIKNSLRWNNYQKAIDDMNENRVLYSEFAHHMTAYKAYLITSGNDTIARSADIMENVIMLDMPENKVQEMFQTNPDFKDCRVDIWHGKRGSEALIATEKTWQKVENGDAVPKFCCP